MVEKALSSEFDKDVEATELGDMRKLFTKGLVAKEDIVKGTTIERRHIDAKKPCLGIPAAQVEDALGKKASRHIRKDEHIAWSDLC